MFKKTKNKLAISYRRIPFAMPFNECMQTQNILFLTLYVF